MRRSQRLRRRLYCCRNCRHYRNYRLNRAKPVRLDVRSGVLRRHPFLLQVVAPRLGSARFFGIVNRHGHQLQPAQHPCSRKNLQRDRRGETGVGVDVGFVTRKSRGGDATLCVTLIGRLVFNVIIVAVAFLSLSSLSLRRRKRKRRGAQFLLQIQQSFLRRAFHGQDLDVDHLLLSHPVRPRHDLLLQARVVERLHHEHACDEG